MALEKLAVAPAKFHVANREPNATIEDISVGRLENGEFTQMDPLAYLRASATFRREAKPLEENPYTVMLRIKPAEGYEHAIALNGTSDTFMGNYNRNYSHNFEVPVVNGIHITTGENGVELYSGR